jgi:6-pyruvoyltetrahydropterin/6-carboxytetrahydropterin synthase
MTEIFKEFTFEAAHLLPRVAPEHKCARLHGHSFRVRVYVAGPVSASGWILDFAEIAAAWQPLHALLDHRYLNEVEGLDNPTSEVIARWIFERLKPALPGVSRVVLHETCTAGAVTVTGRPGRTPPPRRLASGSRPAKAQRERARFSSPRARRRRELGVRPRVASPLHVLGRSSAATCSRRCRRRGVGRVELRHG